VGWLALAMFVVATSVVVWLGFRYPDISGEAAISIWFWLAFGMVPVCIWYYGRSSKAMPRRGGASDAQLAKGFLVGGFITLGVALVIALAGAWFGATPIAWVGLTMIAIAAARRSTARAAS